MVINVAQVLLLSETSHANGKDLNRNLLPETNFKKETNFQVSDNENDSSILV